jgi:type VII secretion integral membrane protein EccD
MDTGLSRITVHTSYRRLDVALPERTPVAELLPELLRHAGAPPAEEPGGWVLRRTGGQALSAARGLRDQQVHDGAVLHLVPERLQWTEPAYDDPAEQVAAAARQRGGGWDARSRSAATLTTCALLLVGGLAVVLLRTPAVGPAAPAGVAGALLAAAGYRVRRGGHRYTGSVLGTFALPYAFAAGASWAGGDLSVPAGAAALLLVSSAGIWLHHLPGVPAADRDRVGGYVAGATVALVGGPAGLVASVWDAAVAAALLACVVVCGVAALPPAAVRLAGLPPPPAGGGTTAGPDPVRIAVARADHLLTGLLVGWSVLAVAATGVLVTGGGPAGGLLAALTATALLMRSRVFVAVRQRLALLAGGVAGWAVVAGWLLPVTPDAALPAVVVAAAAGALVVARVGGTAAGTAQAGTAAGAAAGTAAAGTAAGAAAGTSAGPAPGVERLAGVVDLVAVVGVVPLAAAVLGLYGDAVALMTAR